MEWEEYKDLKSTLMNYRGNLQETDIKCPKCGEPIYKDLSIVLTTYPPQYRYTCLKCGWEDTYF